MFDAEGFAMGLKEPTVLNDIVGWRLRGAKPEELARVLDLSLALLTRLFAPDEAVVIKPSNAANSFAPAILALARRNGLSSFSQPSRISSLRSRPRGCGADGGCEMR